MSEVTLEIGGRHYTVSCGEGEEAQVIKLGQLIHEKMTAIAGAQPVSENQALLFTALMLADELQEAGAKQAEPSRVLDDPDLATALERFAEVIENCAEKLESRVPAT